MDLAKAKELTGGLSNTSKMPGSSYSLPAHACKTGQKLRNTPGTVCSKCYACKGRYLFGNVKKCLDKRLASLTHPDWTKMMIALIREEVRKHPETGMWFRWHDSGDIQSLEHLNNIFQIAEALPKVRFWLPTKELTMVKEYLKNHTIPDNLTVRISAHMIDKPLKPDHFPTSVAITDNFKPTPDVPVHHCPAPKQEGQCGDCRNCWKSSIRVVGYHLH